MQRHALIVTLSLAISGLVFVAGTAALLFPDSYTDEYSRWISYAGSQHWINVIFIVPFLPLTAAMIPTKANAGFLWVGTLLYMVYTFLNFCFHGYSDSLYFFYCVILGLSVFSSVYGICSLRNQHFKTADKTLSTVTGSYLIATALLVCGTWLAEVTPPASHLTIPEGLEVLGLFTGSAQAVDFALFLPVVFLSGIFVLKRSKVGKVMAPVVLTFMTLLDLTILIVMASFRSEDVDRDLFLLLMMAGKTVISASLLTLHLRANKRVP